MALDPQPQPVIRLVCDQAKPEAHSVEPPDLRSERIKEFLQASNLAANTRKSYRLELDRFIGWSNKTWVDVTPRDVARFKQYLMDECQTRQGKPLSPSAINQALTALKSFYKWFQLSGYMELAAVLPTAAVKFEKLGNPLPRHLSHEQVSAIAQAVTGDQDIDLRGQRS
ncbi:phage integrase N-terminal SAM-like domain-containing protein [Microcoleus sp. FACHB-1515]|uniref:tyrosine-type recombinase/integrase n=1 Tax=Cyanophyceae TaxID=3028117 RepID=UPI0016824445|nr:phage integrase N-terminal SAM-like domain-containing protein [Microcoleus sp. FACHB-1515]MBD2091117.1 phage integrase N-terminal SAM-like domain-containing protein [Microcoleus sp. FACHB-1515]